MRRFPILLAALHLLLATLVAGGGAAAQQPPACRAETAGIVTCMAGRLCECRFERPGRMTGVPSGGWRWDCGILRPACGGGPDTPATTSDHPQTLPPQFGLDLTLPPAPPRPRPRVPF